MPWAWMAIRLTARSLLSEPSRSTTVPVGRPNRPWRATSTATRSPSTAPAVAPGGIAEFAAELLLVDRHQPAAAAGQAAENAEHAMLGAIDELDDAAAGLLVAGSLDADQRAVADAGDFARPGAARRGDADDRRRAVRLFVPFGRPRQKFAVAVAAGDVGEHDGRQRAGVMQPLAPAVDLTFVGEFAQHAVERGAVGILGAEGARDLARCRPCRCARG